MEDVENTTYSASEERIQALIIHARAVEKQVEKYLKGLKDRQKTIHKHNVLYHKEQAPIIPDQVFDQLLTRLDTEEEKLTQSTQAITEQLNALKRVKNKQTQVAIDHRESNLKQIQQALLHYIDQKKYARLSHRRLPSQQVGGAPTKHFPTVAHKQPMLSLANTYSMDEVRAFTARIRKHVGEGIPISYACEQKFDGVAISLIYEQGRLTQAITRGDGTKGDLVTNNIRTIRDIPQKTLAPSPPYFEVRGEVLLTKKNFEALNTKRREADEPTYANPRNTVAGTLKLQDSGEVKTRKLSIYCHGILCKEIPHDTHTGCMAHLKSWGFPLSDTTKCFEELHDIEAYIAYWKKHRKDLPVETDGIVIKVANINQQKSLGNTAKYPRWAIAYKYKPDTASTRLLAVTYQVGRTGTITPVAQLEPVLLQGSMVARASLYNQQELKRLNLCIGDLVYVEKGGDIIPKVLGLAKHGTYDKKIHITFPTHCPACNTALQKQADEAGTYCPNNANCTTQILGRILHFISRKALNITALGRENVRGLLNAGLIKDAGDLYSLKEKQLQGMSIPIEGNSNKTRSLQKKSVQNILQGIEASKQIPFAQLLFGIGIRHIGETTARKLAQHFKSLDALIQADEEELLSVGDIGQKAAVSVQTYLQNNLPLFEKLKKVGLQLRINAPIGPQPLQNMRFVISGTFQEYSREELRKRIHTLGGLTLTAPSKNTHYLIAGTHAGPTKSAKANKLGIPICSEEEFEVLINKLKK